MTDKEAMQQALEALDKLSKLGNGNQDGNSLGNTIAQEARERLFTALAEPTVQDSLTVAEQEPVACIKTNGELMWLKKPSTIYSKPRPLYAAPPRREWVGLTDDEIDSCFEEHGWSPSNDYYPVIKDIEAKLREKNA